METTRALFVFGAVSCLLVLGNVSGDTVLATPLPLAQVAPAVDGVSRDLFGPRGAIVANLGAVGLLAWYVWHSVKIVDPRHEKAVLDLVESHKADMQAMAFAHNATVYAMIENCKASKEA